MCLTPPSYRILPVRSQICQAKLSSCGRPSVLCPTPCSQIHRDNAKKYMIEGVLRSSATLESVLGHVQ